MATNVNQSDNALNVTIAESIPNQPTPAGNDGPSNSANPNATGSISSAPPISPGTRTRTPGTSPSVTTRPNLNLATDSSTSLRPSRSRVQTASRPMSPLERRPTGPGLVIHDPIRGDIGHHQVYLPVVSGEGDPVGVPTRRGSGGTVGRVGVSAPARPRSIFSQVDGTMVGNGPTSWPGSARGSRFMFTEGDVPPKEKTVQERLKPTLDAATTERDKYQKRAKQQRLTINGAIGLQVILGALTTGIAAAGSNHIGPAVAVLGGITTIIASYLAKVRGSGEPEFSSIRTKELKSFLREIHAFITDRGERPGTEHDEGIRVFRERFEAIVSTEMEEFGPGGHHPQRHSALHPTPYVIPPAHVASRHPGAMGEKQMMWKNEKAVTGII